jgi:hypothetical protein
LDAALLDKRLRNLTQQQRDELIVILNWFLNSLDKINDINLGHDSPDYWMSLAAEWRDSIRLIEANGLPSPLYLKEIIDEGPDGNGIGMHLFRDEWMKRVGNRNAYARKWLHDLIAQLQQSSKKKRRASKTKEKRYARVRELRDQGKEARQIMSTLKSEGMPLALSTIYRIIKEF